MNDAERLGISAVTPYEHYQRTQALKQFVELLGHQDPHQRRGQYVFNVLLDTFPLMAEKIRGDIFLDPFYKDALIEPCLSWLFDHWFDPI